MQLGRIRSLVRPLERRLRATSWLMDPLRAARTHLRSARTRLRKHLGLSDRSWETTERVALWWDLRNVALARFVPPGSTVFEFGAGRCVLGEHLSPDCTYLPSDLVARGPDMIAYDLNARRLAPLPEADVAVFSGVLEFVNDVPRALDHLRAHGVEHVVASYMAFPEPLHPTVVDRRAAGVVNDYSHDEVIALFAEHGYACVEDGVWEHHRLYHFVAR